MTEPLELVLKTNPTQTVAWACGKCRIVAPGQVQGKYAARGCCAPRVCDECGGERTDPYAYTNCQECRAKHDAKEAARVIEKAEELGSYDGYLYSDARDSYHADIGEYLEECENEDQEPEEFLFACTSATLAMDADSIVESALEDHHEDAYEQVGDHDELQKLLDEWCAKQSVTTYYPDFKRVVRVGSVS